MSIVTVSARGQVAIPSDMREKLGIVEGEKVVFLLDGDSLLLRKASSLSWAQLTRPLRHARKKLGEAGVPALVEKLRK